VSTRGLFAGLQVENGGRWKVENKPSRDVMQNQRAAASVPARVSRSMAACAAGTGSRTTAGERDSSIVFDRTERRFVNSDAARSTAHNASEANQNKNGAVTAEGQVQGSTRARVSPEPNRSGNTTSRVPPASDRTNGREGQAPSVPNARAAVPRPTVAPPSVPRAVTTQRVFNEGNSSSGASARGGSNAPSSPSPRASAPAPSASSGSGGRPSRGNSASGERPH